MAQAQSQLLLHMFGTKIYFVKLDFSLFSGKIWETLNGEKYMDRQANNTKGSSGIGTAIFWYIYWENILYGTGERYAFCKNKKETYHGFSRWYE